MSILNKTIQNISFDDIRNLVEAKIPEGDIIDYKSELPRDKIHKLIASFANSHGGWIILGVETEKGTNKPCGFKRIKENNLEDTIQNIILSRIMPPVMSYDCKYLDGSSGEKVFVIKIEESDLTPHVTLTDDGFTNVYLREKAVNKPYRRANLDEIEWLKYRRKKYTNHREQISERCKKRFNKVLNDLPRTWPYYELCIAPKYPRPLCKSQNDLRDIFRPLNCLVPSIGIPKSRLIDSMLTADETLYVNEARDNSLRTYFEINLYGFYYSAGIFSVMPDIRYDYENSPRVIEDLFFGIRNSFEFLKKVNFVGTISISFNLRNLRGHIALCRVLFFGFQNYIDEEYSFDREYDFNQFYSKPNEIFEEIIDSIDPALGGNIWKEDFNKIDFYNIIKSKYGV
jgi:hypothetical protein